MEVNTPITYLSPLDFGFSKMSASRKLHCLLYECLGESHEFSDRVCGKLGHLACYVHDDVRPPTLVLQEGAGLLRTINFERVRLSLRVGKWKYVEVDSVHCSSCVQLPSVVWL